MAPPASATPSYRLLAAIALVVLAVGTLAVPVAAAGGADAAPAQSATDDPFAEPDASAHVDDLDDRTYWHGVTLEVTGFEPSETVAIRTGGHLEEVVADGDGAIVIDTGRYLTPNELDVTGRQSGASGSFDVEAQHFQRFQFEPPTPIQPGQLVIDTTRVGYNVTLEADGVDAARLAGAIEGAEVVDGRAVLQVRNSDQTERSVYLSELPDAAFELHGSVPDSTAAASTTIEPIEEPGDTVTFSFDTRQTDLGDRVELDIEEARGTDTAWLTVEEDRGYFNAALAVTLADSAESATVSWNSHHSLNRSRTLGFSAGENVHSVRVVEAGGEAFGVDHWPNDGDWSFTLEAFTSRDDIDTGDFHDVAGVTFEERETVGVTTHVVPGFEHAHDDDLAELRSDAIENSSVARDDLLVAEVETEGVFGYLNATPEGFAREGLSLGLVAPADLNRTPLLEPRSLPASDLAGDASIVARPSEESLYLVVDTGALPRFESSDQWTVEFAVDGAANPYLPDDEVEAVSQPVDVEDRTIEFTGDVEPEIFGPRLQLPASSDATVTAETNVAPGTEVNMRINLPRDFRAGSGEVQPDGTISIPVDLSSVDPGTRLSRIRLRAPNVETEATIEGVVAAGPMPAFDVDASTPDELEPGEDGTLDVTVTNEGNVTGTASIAVAVNASGRPDETIVVEQRLVPGATWTETFDVGAPASGTVNWHVETQDDCRAGSTTVREPISIDGHEPAPLADGDGLYRDFDGDGRLTHADVGAFFRHHFYPAVQNETRRFDFNDNGVVGHGDVVALFQTVASQPLGGSSAGGQAGTGAAAAECTSTPSG